MDIVVNTSGRLSPTRKAFGGIIRLKNGIPVLAFNGLANHLSSIGEIALYVVCEGIKAATSLVSRDMNDAVLEVLAAHFLLLVSDESSFEKFLNKLFRWHREETLFDGLSLTADMQLIGNSVLLSAPQGNISLQVTKLSDPWHHPVSETKSDLMDASVLCVKQNEHINEDCHRDEIVSFVNFIISRTLYSGQGSTLLTNSGEVTQEDIVLLASMIDLMSSSLLQTVRSGCQNTLNENSCFKEYEFIIGIISCFRQFSVSPPIRKLLSCAAKHKESKLMLIHFVDLLLYSFAKGLEVLRNVCIFMIMTVMNLFIFEEGRKSRDSGNYDRDGVGNASCSRYNGIPSTYFVFIFVAYRFSYVW
ncbi:hypothetical protein GIB67_027222 [Kingdonia uniflora]|uniref:DUF7812 domain-containing protein n=1 Tax=Kingdonia uniflora TaxID=39325 RepID=A0A7J7KYD7_9MAGN|nr:hypothetical protein GIB67_027222 [Kingdonia uniflora]